jgi:hypothetical protein
VAGPPSIRGGPMATPGQCGWPNHPKHALFSFSFLFFFLKKISLFIYFLINLYFFIKIDTCHHLIDDT